MTAADPGEATQTFTFSIPGLGGGIEISGVSSSGDTQEGAGGGGRGRVAISIPGGLGTLLGGSGGGGGGVIDDFFGLGGDSDTAAGGVSVSFNFPSGAESLGSLGSILGGGEGGGGIFGSGNTPFGLNGFFLDSDSSSSSSFSDFNALFSGSRPRTTTPSPLGDFSELSGGPWTQ